MKTAIFNSNNRQTQFRPFLSNIYLNTNMYETGQIYLKIFRQSMAGLTEVNSVRRCRFLALANVYQNGGLDPASPSPVQVTGLECAGLRLDLTHY